MRLFSLFVLLFSLVSCDQEIEYEFELRSYIVDNQLAFLDWGMGERTWEDELNYSFEGAGKDSLLSCGLEMIEYSLLKDSLIMGCEANIEEIADSMFIPVYGDSTNLNKFRLLSFTVLAPMLDIDVKSIYMSKKMDFLKECLGEELKIVKIKWKYGETIFFETKCLVTDEQMIYDDVLSNIRYLSIEAPLIANNTFFYKRIKTRGEDPGNDKYPISYKYMSPSYVCYTASHTFGKQAI